MAREAASRNEIEVDDGISNYTRDPLILLSVFRPLRLSPGWTLVTQIEPDPTDHRCFTWAIPKSGPYPDLFIETWPEDPEPPPGAVSPLMVIEGNQSPWSFLCASLLARELSRLGAEWHGCDWWDHQLYGGEQLKGDWEFKGPRPGSYNPTVSVSEENVIVTFYSRTDLPEGRIVRHTDRYKARAGYQFETEATVLATGPEG